MAYKPKLAAPKLELTLANEIAIREYFSFLLALVIHDARRGKRNSRRCFEEIQNSLFAVIDSDLQLNPSIYRAVQFTVLKKELKRVVPTNTKGRILLDNRNQLPQKYRYLKKHITSGKTTLDSLTKKVFLERHFDQGISERMLARDLRAFDRWGQKYTLLYMGSKVFAGPHSGDDLISTYQLFLDSN